MLGNLKLNQKKCQFFKRSMSFLCHVISSKGITTDETKVTSVLNWPIPVNTQELHRFLGLVSYYQRFMQSFAHIAASLTEEYDTAFKTLKQKLISAPIITYPQLEGTFHLDTDASDQGIGAVLLQEQNGAERVIAYGSWTLTRSERNYCTTRKELLALLYFVRNFRSYLLGHPFVVCTDHAALQWIQSFKEPEGQVARWLEQLQEFRFQTEHRQGKKHQNADTISRIPCRQCGLNHSTGQRSETRKIENVYSLTTTYTWTPAWSTQELREAQRSDPTIGRVLGWLEKGAG